MGGEFPIMVNTKSVNGSDDSVRLGRRFEPVPGSHFNFTCDFFGFTPLRRTAIVLARSLGPIVQDRQVM